MFYLNRGSRLIHALSYSRAESFSLFSELHDSNLEKVIASTEALGPEIESTPLETEYVYPDSPGYEGQLKQVAKLIKTGVQNHAMERAAFFTSVGGFDTHSNMLSVTDEKYAEINKGLEKFVAEMKAQNLWDNVVLVTTSDFARTLPSNGVGTVSAFNAPMCTTGLLCALFLCPIYELSHEKQT